MPKAAIAENPTAKRSIASVSRQGLLAHPSAIAANAKMMNNPVLN